MVDINEADGTEVCARFPVDVPGGASGNALFLYSMLLVSGVCGDCECNGISGNGLPCNL